MNAHSMNATVGLAPMEGVTGFAARIFFHLASAPATLATPFLRVTSSYPHRALPPDFLPELTALSGKQVYPIVVQLMAAQADDFLRACEFLLDHVSFVEINCGCPSPTCVGKGAGSSMLKDPDSFHRDMSRLAQALGPQRFAVKMRTGFAEHSEFPALLAGLANLDLARLTVHGRTRPQGYTGHARWDLIGIAAQTARAPVIASGDIVSHGSFSALMAEAPAVSGGLVGRGALRNPWIFSELRSASSVQIAYPALRAALLCFALLHELPRHGSLQLVAAIDGGLLAAPCGVETTRWQAAADLLAKQLSGEPWPHGDLKREAAFAFEHQTLGRLKLLWNYLRSSLPPAFFAPQTLRAKSVGDMLAHIDLIAAEQTEVLTLAHDPSRDWIYAGSKKS